MAYIHTDPRTIRRRINVCMGKIQDNNIKNNEEMSSLIKKEIEERVRNTDGIEIDTLTLKTDNINI